MSGIDNRKDILLLLLYSQGASGQEAEPIKGKTRLMKLLFLLGREKRIDDKLGVRNWYDFKAYDYGPFSSQVFDDIDFLRNVDLIQTSKSGFQTIAETWENELALEESLVDREDIEFDRSYEQEDFTLTPLGRDFVEQTILSDQKLTYEILSEIKSLKSNEGALTLSSLLKYVYRKYPEAAVESKLEHIGG